MAADKNIIEFERNPWKPQRRVTKAVVERSTTLDIGGGEGEKYLYQLVHPENKRSFGQFFSKSQERYDENYVKRIVDAYEIARQEGFPVPPTTRYFEEGRGKSSILMTDMSERRKYLVWGWNDKAAIIEGETLKTMKINEEDKIKIHEQCEEILKNAEKHKRSISFYNYHIRKDTKTGKIELFLLDLGATFAKQYDLKIISERNREQAQIFIELASSSPEEHKKILESHKSEL